MRHSWKVWLGVVAIAAGIAHACDYWFGISNQATYFVEPLHRVHPELFHHDWLVTTTTSYHRVWGVFASALFRIDDSGIYTTAIAHVLVMIATVIGVFVVVDGTAQRRVFAAFAILAAWLLITGDRSLAGSYVWGGYLQPSSLATLGWVIALAMYVRRRPFATGIALAAGGVFHANYLVLGIGVFALAELVTERGDYLRRLAWLLAPQLVALAVLAPDLMTSARSSEPELALWVLSKFHAALHYSPYSIRHDLLGFARWAVLAFAVAPVAAAYARAPAVRRLLVLAAIMSAICIATDLLALIPPLLTLTRLYVWRMAPFAQLASQIVIAVAVVATLDAPELWRAQPRWRVAAAAVLAVWLAATEVVDANAEGGWMWWIALAAIALAVAAPRWRSALPAVAAAGCLALAFGERAGVIVHPHLEVSTGDAATGELYDWVRANTPVDAQFLASPDLGGFRLLARRAVVADFKSPPLVPDELVAWYRRLCRMAGLDHAKNVPEVRSGWLFASGAQLLARARELGTQYVVVDHAIDNATFASPPLYQNAVYAVYPTGL